MDRRRFIKKSGQAALVGITGLSGQRAFGEPDSLVPAEQQPPIGPVLFRLHLQIADVPDAQIERFQVLHRVVLDVLKSPASARAFARNPGRYFASAGLPAVNVDTNSPEFRIIAALGDPVVRKAAIAGDSVAFIRALRRIGIIPKKSEVPMANSFFVPVVAVAAALVLVVAAAVVAVAVATPVLAYAQLMLWTKVSVFAHGPVSRHKAPRPGVPAARLNIGNPTAELARITGGNPLAYQVQKTMATAEVNKIIRAIEKGQIELAPDVSKAEIIGKIRLAMARHLP